MKKGLCHQVGARSFMVESILLMGKEPFCKAYKDVLQDAEGEYKTMQEKMKQHKADEKAAEKK